MRLEGFAQVLDVDIKNVLYTKIFNSEDEEDGAPFVAPKSVGGGGLVAWYLLTSMLREVLRRLLVSIPD